MSYSVRQNPANPSNYTPNRKEWGGSISEIVIHHAATTDFDGIGATFKNQTRGASAHYGVGTNSNVDQYVDENDIAWHAGNWGHNTRSIGIENVNISGAPDWNIAGQTFATLVELVHDIAQRNGLLPLVVGKNLFGHNDVSDKRTECPGQLEGMLQQLADKVNAGEAGGTVPNPQPVENAPDQVLHIGEKFVFPKPYRVDGLAFFDGIWQVQNNELCPKGFTWADNGIPTPPINEVAGGVGNPNDQVLQVGSNFEIPGTFTVLNLGFTDGMWLAQISDGGWKFWVDIATVTEVN
ncbi:MAG TPA: N-acetylmuramoyl-L-alanine amidase [Dongiaceae bacterium]|nr:N-acetylmuramoyl-L-alanine amidase [Dongiaceae bacterium]